jgi:hypothetical protein
MPLLLTVDWRVGAALPKQLRDKSMAPQNIEIDG